GQPVAVVPHHVLREAAIGLDHLAKLDARSAIRPRGEIIDGPPGERVRRRGRGVVGRCGGGRRGRERGRGGWRRRVRRGRRRGRRVCCGERWLHGGSFRRRGWPAAEQRHGDEHHGTQYRASHGGSVFPSRLTLLSRVYHAGGMESRKARKRRGPPKGVLNARLPGVYLRVLRLFRFSVVLRPCSASSSGLITSRRTRQKPSPSSPRSLARTSA